MISTNAVLEPGMMHIFPYQKTLDCDTNTDIKTYQDIYIGGFQDCFKIFYPPCKKQKEMIQCHGHFSQSICGVKPSTICKCSGQN